MKKKAGKRKILIPVIIGMLVMSAAFVVISYTTFRDTEIEDCEVYAKELTRLITDEVIDPNCVDAYLERGRNIIGYNTVEQRLYRLRKAYPDVEYLYVYQFREDGIHVVFDLNTARFAGTNPGAVIPYYSAYEKYIPDLLAGRQVPSISSWEEYGHVLTVMTPLYDRNGVCKCYVGADCSLDKLSDYVWNIIRRVACFFGIVLVLVLAYGIFVTEHHVVRKMDRLENRAYVDTLTGLQNRTAYYEYNDVLNKKEDGGKADFSILMIDVNYLKKMNDTYGHEQGNLYLQRAAELIRGTFGDEHTYRIGGDEFVVILEGKAQEGAEEKISAFREEMARQQADESLQPWEKVSAAAGMAKYEQGRDATTEEVLRRADEAMYREKIAMKAVRTD